MEIHVLGQNIDVLSSKHARNVNSDHIFMPRRQISCPRMPISESLWAQNWSPFPDPQDARNLRFLTFLRILEIWESGISQISQIPGKVRFLTFPGKCQFRKHLQFLSEPGHSEILESLQHLTCQNPCQVWRQC